MTTKAIYSFVQNDSKFFSLSRYQTILQYTITSLAALLAFGLVIDLLKRDLHIPMSYSGDALFMANWVKTILDTGWYLNNPSLAMPGEFSLGNFPISEGLNTVLVHLLSLISRDWAFVFNSIYILSYPLAACTALFCFKRLGLEFPCAFGASLIYALLPYHFLRGQFHLCLSLYYIVPLGIWFGFWLCETDISKNIQNKIILLVLSLCIGSTVVYYPFFTCFFMLILGLLYTYSKRNWNPLKNVILGISLITLVLALNIWPFLKYVITHGKLPVTAARHFIQAEMFGFKLLSILLPSDQHRFQSFSKLVIKYNSHNPFPTIGEFWQYLGIVAVIGFVALIVIAILPRKETDKMFMVSKLHISGILLGVVGGFGGMFAYLVTPMIRCYNRINIFLAFFSIYTFFWVFQRILKKPLFHKRPKLLWAFLFLVVCFGLYEQTSSEFKKYIATSESFNNHREYVQALEAILPKGSKVLQLPYDCFPECTPPGKMGPYDHLKLYLQSENLRWSYGAMKGTANEVLQCGLAAKKPKELLKDAIALGFTGISINRKGYEDEAKSLEANLSRLLRQKPLIAKDGGLSFFDLRGFKEK